MLTWADGAALLAVFVWGANFPVMKLVMTVVDPFALMFVRGALASAVLTGVLWRSGRWRLPAGREMRPLLVVSLVGYSLNQVLYANGLHLTTASHSGIIFALTPLFVFVASHALGLGRMDRLDALGLGLGIAGAVLVLGVPALAGDARGGASLLGDLLTVGAAITWGIWTILAAPILGRHGTLLGTTWITLLGTLGLLPVSLPGLVSQGWRLAWPVVLGLLYSAAVAGALGSVLWYAAVRRIGPARTAVYSNMESFFAVIAAALMLGERVEWTAVLGGGAVVAGVLLTRRTSRGRVE